MVVIFEELTNHIGLFWKDHGYNVYNKIYPNIC